MSMQTPTGYKDGAWEIYGAQVISTLGQTPWVLNAMDIEYLQMQHGADYTILWLKARAVEQPYQVGRYDKNAYTFASALSDYAAKYGIPVYNSQIGSETQDRVQNAQATQTVAQVYPQTQSYQQQTGYAQQQGYPPQTGYAQQQAYPSQSGYAQQQAYPPQSGYAQQQASPQQSGYAPQQAYPPQSGYAPQQAYPQQPYPPQGAYPQQGYSQQAGMSRAPTGQAARPTARRRKKGSPKLVFLGIFLIIISIFIASTAADKGSSFPLIVVGIVMLLLGGKSGRSRGRSHSGYYHGNQYYNDATRSDGFTDRDNDGIDDRYDSFVDADGDGIDDNDGDDGDDGGDDGGDDD